MTTEVSDDKIEEKNRVKTFIEKAKTVKQLKRIQSQIPNDLYNELKLDFEERELEIIHNDATNE